jgi:hypothetical protein
LKIANVVGIFLCLIFGCVAAIIFAIFEMLLTVRERAKENQVSKWNYFHKLGVFWFFSELVLSFKL